jgi:modified peptide precursor CbpA
MKKQEKIISYRRRCRNSEQGTGLSHYILLTPKADTKK